MPKKHHHNSSSKKSPAIYWSLSGRFTLYSFFILAALLLVDILDDIVIAIRHRRRLLRRIGDLLDTVRQESGGIWELDIREYSLNSLAPRRRIAGVSPTRAIRYILTMIPLPTYLAFSRKSKPNCLMSPLRRSKCDASPVIRWTAADAAVSIASVTELTASTTGAQG